MDINACTYFVYLFRSIIANKMDIRGGYARPTYKDVLWVQLILLPLTIVR